ncbi:MAG: hypothetical protein V1862_06430 [Methanobacteriota archaeon]
MNLVRPDTIQTGTGKPERYPVSPFDFYSDLICCFSNQIIHMVIHLEGQMNYELLSRAVFDATQAEPITWCHLVLKQDTLWWEMNPDLEEKDLVISLPVPDPREILHEALSYPIDPYLGPMIQVVLIQSSESEKGDILVINAHHAVMDGRGLKDIAALIMARYNNLRNGDHTKLLPTPLSQRQFPKVSTLISGNDNNLSNESLEAWLSKASVPIRSSRAEKSQYSLLTLTAERMKIIQSTRKEWVMTINDLLISVIARVCSSVISEATYQVIPLFTTIDLRRYLPDIPVRSVMNCSTAFEVRVPVKKDDSLKETGILVHHLMNEIKAGTPGLDGVREAERLYEEGHVAATAELQTAWDEILRTGTKTTLFSNTGIICRESIDPGVPLVTYAYILPTHSLPPGFFFALSTFGDQMMISATYYTPAYDPTLVQRIFLLIDQIIPGYEISPGTYQIL